MGCLWQVGHWLRPVCHILEAHLWNEGWERKGGFLEQGREGWRVTTLTSTTVKMSPFHISRDSRLSNWEGKER
jgi:hypothetical protein